MRGEKAAILPQTTAGFSRPPPRSIASFRLIFSSHRKTSPSSTGLACPHRFRLAEWKNNDVVKLAFLEGEEAERVDALDLTGVSELKRNANGTFEAKFVPPL